MSTHKDHEKVLEQVHNLLLEHAGKFVVVVEFLDEDPAICGHMTLAKYASPSEVLGLLSWAEKKTSYDLAKEFEEEDEA